MVAVKNACMEVCTLFVNSSICILSQNEANISNGRADVPMDLPRLQLVLSEMSKVLGEDQPGFGAGETKKPIVRPDRFASSKFGFVENRLRRVEDPAAVKTHEYGRKSVHEPI